MLQQVLVEESVPLCLSLVKRGVASSIRGCLRRTSLAGGAGAASWIALNIDENIHIMYCCIVYIPPL